MIPFYIFAAAPLHSNRKNNTAKKVCRKPRQITSVSFFIKSFIWLYVLYGSGIAEHYVMISALNDTRRGYERHLCILLKLGNGNSAAVAHC